jgi:hypothetical protein
VPTPTGTIGNPNVPCLIGYVWRQAYAGDYVCVTPATRSQAAADDAAASSRIQQGGGLYGPYTCLQGYVWRQVVPDDYTCVIPAVRSQAAYDNSQAGNRVALLHLWVTDWYLGKLGPDIEINGDLFNFGQVMLQVRRSSDGSVMWEQQVTATPLSGLPGGAISDQTSVVDCSNLPYPVYNYYVVAQDVSSGRYSNEIPIDSYCV